MCIFVHFCVYFPSVEGIHFYIHTRTHLAAGKRDEGEYERRGASFVTREVAVECVVCVFVKETEICLCGF